MSDKMPVHFFDTSAISKHYHAETGTAKVNALLDLPDASQVISRLSVVELHSVFAKKVRIGELDQANFQKLTRRFRVDVAVLVRPASLPGQHSRGPAT